MYRNDDNKSLHSELEELKEKLQEKQMTIVQLEQEKKSLTDENEYLQHQGQLYDSNFMNELQGREHLVVNNHTRKQHLKGKEQFSRHGNEVTHKFVQGDQRSDVDQLQL